MSSKRYPFHHFHRLRHHKMTVGPMFWHEDLVIASITTPTTFTSPNLIAASDISSNRHDSYNDDTINLMVAATTSTAQKREGPDLLAHFFTVWAVVVVVMSLAVVTLVANSTILTMFVLRKSLRKCKNIYIASLAAADLGIGLTIPAAALEQVESHWVLEGVFCHLFQTVRCSLLYVSLLSILLITLDRWWSIHYPFSYRVRQSKRLAAVAVSMVWLASFAMHVPPVFLWDFLIGSSDTDGVQDQIGGLRTSGYEQGAGAEDSLPGLYKAYPKVQTSTPLPYFPPPLSSELSSSSSSALLAMLTTTTTTGPMSLLSSEGSKTSFYFTADGQLEISDHFRQKRLLVNERRRCELPYDLHFSFVLTVSTVLYFFPLLALWLLNCSIYFKITRRKSIKIRRSLSVNDNYLLTFRKSSSESESSPNNGGDNDGPCGDIRSAEHRQRLLAAARAGRRHTLAFPGHHPKFGGSGAGGIYYPSQNASRNHMARRISLQEAFTGIGSMAAMAGAIPNLPRVTSCGRFTGSNSMTPMGLWFPSGHRQSVCSSRKQSEDLVKELLVRQDKKAARLLGLLVTVFTICWLPYTVVAVLRADDPTVVSGWVRDVTFWVLLANSGINPFLYGLLNAEFRKILRGWFYFPRQTNYRLKHALLYWSLPPHGDSDGLKDTPTTYGRFATPIKE